MDLIIRILLAPMYFYLAILDFMELNYWGAARKSYVKRT